jgi:hypothetical protein
VILDPEDNVVLDCSPTVLDQGGNHQAHEVQDRNLRSNRSTTSRVP